MGRVRDVLQLLLLSSLCGLHCGQQHDGCENFHLQFERVFSVPGDVALLVSTLLSTEPLEPYSVTWYRLHSEQPLSNQSGRLLVLGPALWILNVSLEDAGDYVTVVRTPQRCLRQETKLVVELPRPGCGRPQTSGQRMIKGVNDLLFCPLTEHMNRLQRYSVPYSITWYKGCQQIFDGTQRFSFWDSSLKVARVESADEGLYTCTLHFSLGGTRGSVSETIDADVRGDYYWDPQIRAPAKDVVRAELGSNVTKRCLVFVPCVGRPLLDIDLYWTNKTTAISDDPRHRVYMTEERKEIQEGGVLIERWLIISELKEEDLNQSYTCQVLSSRSLPSSHFTLQLKDPELLIPVSVSIGCCLLLFLLCVSVFYVFKLELVLWFRGTFPMLYLTSDEKLYDAYVAYPQRCSSGWTDEVERFALQTLPQVLEEACGFSLFIPDRDSLPGEAVTDTVDENLRSSRRVILLYTATTFSNKDCSNNNNTLLSRPLDQTDSDHHSQTKKKHLNTHKDPLNTSKDPIRTSINNLNTSKDYLKTSKDHLNTSKDHRSTSMYNLNTNKDLNTSKDHLNISKYQLNTSLDHLYANKDRFSTGKEHLTASKEHLTASKEHHSINKDYLNNNKYHYSTKEHLNTNKDHLNASKDHSNTNKDHLNTSKDYLNTTQGHYNISTDHLNTTKDQLNSSKVPTTQSPQRCECRCDHARAQLECVMAMQRALLERSLKVILVELEELGPSDLEQLPESVRHLRQSQGAVCLWRSPGTRWRTGCMRRRTAEDTDTVLSSCVSPDCRFWKEVRYKMPVRAKWRSPPEATVLLKPLRKHSRTQRLKEVPV